MKNSTHQRLETQSLKRANHAKDAKRKPSRQGNAMCSMYANPSLSDPSTLGQHNLKSSNFTPPRLCCRIDYAALNLQILKCRACLANAPTCRPSGAHDKLSVPSFASKFHVALHRQLVFASHQKLGKSKAD